MVMKVYSGFLLCLISITYSNCGNVLFLAGITSPSHHIWLRTLSHALVANGHNVTSLSVDVDKNCPQNLTYLHLDGIYEVTELELDDYIEMDKMNRFHKLLDFVHTIHRKFFKAQSTEGFQALLQYPDDFRFDLIIVDHLSSPGYLMFAEKFGNPPIISASAYPVIFQTNIITGGPAFPSFVPSHFMEEVDDSFISRLESFVTYALTHALDEYYVYPALDSYIKTVIPGAKPIKEILRSIKIQLVNYNPVQDFVQPLMPSVIPVGGLQITEPNALTLDLEVIYARSTKGVVYFALGSNVKSELLGMDRLTEIIEAFRALPDYLFLWKLDDTGLEIDLPNNVFIRKWLPQNDILADSRTVLFISHAGGLSTQESTWYGVPMLAVPVMLDQFTNAEKVVKSGMGLQLAIKSIERESLKATILELLTNKSYRKQAKKRSTNMRDQPERPLARALWWIDYVLRNPDMSFLRNTKLQEMNVLVKQSVDVIAFLVILFLLLVGGMVKVGLDCVRRRKGRDGKVKEQ